MDEYARLRCRGCGRETEHHRPGPPPLRDARFVLLWIPVAVACWVATLWGCRRCGVRRWPWSRK